MNVDLATTIRQQRYLMLNAATFKILNLRVLNVGLARTAWKEK